MNKQARASYLAGVMLAVKEATGELSVRPPDLDVQTAPATKPREAKADQGRTQPAPKIESDVNPDQSAQQQTVAKQASWDQLDTGERHYLIGIVKACQDHDVNPVTLIPVHYAKAAAAALQHAGERGA
jgi:hypothetical protein